MSDERKIEKILGEIEIVGGNDEVESDNSYQVVKHLGTFVGSYSRQYEVSIILMNGIETVEVHRIGKRKSKKMYFSKEDCLKLAELFRTIPR